MEGLMASLQQTHKHHVLTQAQALRFIGARGKMKKCPPGQDDTDWLQEVREVLAEVCADRDDALSRALSAPWVLRHSRSDAPHVYFANEETGETTWEWPL